MSRKTYYNIIAATCIVLAIATIVGSFKIGADRAMTGQDALVWLHLGAFVAAVVLVVVAIVANARARK